MFIPEIQGIILHNKFFTLSTSVFSNIYAHVYYIRFFIVPIYSTFFHQHRTIFLPTYLQYFSIRSLHITVLFLDISLFPSFTPKIRFNRRFIASTYLLYFLRSHSTRHFPVFKFSFLVVCFPVAIVNLLDHSVLSPLRLLFLSRSRSGVQVRCPPLTFKQREQ